jgi:hypothetical protein
MSSVCLKPPLLDFNNQGLSRLGRFHIKIRPEDFIERIICAQGDADFTILGRQAHNGSAGGLVQLVEAQGCLCKLSASEARNGWIFVAASEGGGQAFLRRAAGSSYPLLEQRA